jgi:exosortase/archaeosortase family protein
MALTAAYAWYTQPTWRRRAALFACSVPLAILGNIVRILSICLVAACANADFALGFYHDYSGYVVFIVAIGCMVACGEVISRVGRRGNGRDARCPSVAATSAATSRNRQDARAICGSGRACRGRSPRVGEKVERIKQARRFVVLFLLAHLSENLCERVLYQNPLKS